MEGSVPGVGAGALGPTVTPPNLQKSVLSDDQFRTPFPVAASSGIKGGNRFLSRFAELASFIGAPGSITLPLDETDRSSLGLVPRNLLRFSTGESFVESPPVACSVSMFPSPVADIDSNTDPSPADTTPKSPRDTEKSCADHSGLAPQPPVENATIPKDNDQSVKLNTTVSASINKTQKSNSLADFSKQMSESIDFSEKHFSARSSTADSFREEIRSGVAPFCSSKTFSRFFSRHSLDVSLLDSRASGGDRSSRFTVPAARHPLPAHIESNVADSIRSDADRSEEEEELMAAKEATEVDESATGANMFFDFGAEQCAGDDHPDTFGVNSFLPGGECLSMLDKEEADNAKDAWVLGDAAEVRAGEDSSLGSSWMTSARPQDISRPSWLGGSDSDDYDRVSIGRFMRERTETCVFDNGGKKYFGLSGANPKLTTSRPSIITEEEKETPPTPQPSRIPNGTDYREGSRPASAAGGTPSLDITRTATFEEAVSILMGQHVDPAVLGSLLLKYASTANLKPPCTTASGGHGVAAPALAEQLVAQGGFHRAVSSLGVEDKIVQVSLDDTAATEAGDDSTLHGSAHSSSSANTLRGASHTSLGSVSQGVPQRIGVSQDHRRAYAANSTSRSSVSSGSSRMSARFSQDEIVEVQPELAWTEPCSVGVEREQWLRMTNRTPRWLEGCLRAAAPTRDGHRLSSDGQQVFLLDERCTLQPNAVARIRVSFAPPAAGLWEARLALAFRALLPSAPDAASWRSHPQTTLRAEAVEPRLASDPPRSLNFGAVLEDGLEMRTLCLTNVCAAPLPLRVLIEGSPVAGEGFYFPTACIDDMVDSDARFVSSLLMRCTLKSSAEIRVPIAFKSPIMPRSDEYNDDPGLLRPSSATVCVELDVGGPSPTLLRLPVTARVAAVQLDTRGDSLELPPLSHGESHSSRPLPLHNAGVLPLALRLRSGDPSRLQVARQQLTVAPGRSEEVLLTYRPFPDDAMLTLDSFVDIEVVPGGPSYRVTVLCHRRHPSRATSAHSCGQPSYDVAENSIRNSLYCNRQQLYWGTVDLLRAVPLNLTLRNLLTSEPLQLQLSIQGDGGAADPCPFQLVNASTTATRSANDVAGLHVSSRIELCLASGAEAVVTVYFLPRTAADHSARLVIKPRQPVVSNKSDGARSRAWIKFSVPLRGYGGAACVRWEGLGDERSPSYDAPRNLPIDCPDDCSALANCVVRRVDCKAGVGSFRLAAHNWGNRPAFVSVLTSLDECCRTQLPDWLTVSVTPSRFVLPEGRSVTVFVSWHPASTTFPSDRAAFHLSLFSGDEVLRRHLRLLSPQLNGPSGMAARDTRDTVARDTFLRGRLRLTEPFSGEEEPASGLETGDDKSWALAGVDQSQLLATVACQRVAVMVSGDGTAAKRPDDHDDIGCDYNENSQLFAPLSAEETLSEMTVVYPSRGGPSSPPSKEIALSRPSDSSVIQLSSSTVQLAATRVGQSSVAKLAIKNVSYQDVLLNIIKPQPPFHLPQNRVNVRSRHYLNLPVSFVPTVAGHFVSNLIIRVASDSGDGLAVVLNGSSFKD